MSKASEASYWAALAHNQQVRKYTGEPYICHLAEVAALVAEYADIDDGFKDDAIAAAFLHDILEDQSEKVSIVEVRSIFGSYVARIVEELTEPERDGNRSDRKAEEARRLSNIGWVSREIKFADLISNTKSIAKHDPSFARVYLREKHAVLNALDRGKECKTALAIMAWNQYYRAIDDLGLRWSEEAQV